MHHLKNKQGFTLIELIVVMSILVTLMGIVTINLITAQQRAEINTVINTFIADSKDQQLKAMVGDTEGRSSAGSYGIHMDSNQYVLFYGSTYDSDDVSNKIVELPDNLEFTTFNTNIIFSQVSGNLPATTQATLFDSSANRQKTIQFNIYGVITAVN